jgi:hypothetical protein
LESCLVGSLGTSWVSRLERVKGGMAFDILHRTNTRAIDIYLQMNMFLLHKVCSDLPLRDERHKKSDLCHKSSLDNFGGGKPGVVYPNKH